MQVILTQVKAYAFVTARKLIVWLASLKPYSSSNRTMLHACLDPVNYNVWSAVWQQMYESHNNMNSDAELK